jgi:hypothetical protein
MVAKKTVRFYPKNVTMDIYISGGYTYQWFTEFIIINS